MNALQLGAAEDQDVIKGAIDQLEKFIGNSGEAGAVSQFGGQPLPPESPLVQYVNAVGTDLVPQIRSSRRDFGYRFGVLDSPIINAFALPNGSIYVTTGLLSKMNSHDELANLLGHELVHVTEHHGVNQIGVNVASELALSTLFTKALAGKLDAEDAELGSQISQQLLSSGYSRANESESDEIGQSLAHRSGYNAQGMSDLMKVFLGLEDEEPGSVEKLFRSHPWSGERVQDAEQRARELALTPVNQKRSQLTDQISFTTIKGKATSATGTSTLPAVFLGASVGLLAIVLYMRYK